MKDKMKKYSDEIKVINRFCADSELTEEDALELGRKVNKTLVERYRKYAEADVIKVNSKGIITIPVYVRKEMGLKTGRSLAIARFGGFIVMVKDLERLRLIESILGKEEDSENITQDKLMKALKQTMKCPECGKVADYCPAGHWLCFECGWQTEGCDHER